MSRLAVSAVVASLLGFGVTATAHADLRSFTHTYEYSTVPEGKSAIELWHTQGRQTWAASSPQFYEQILELEHGLTDHWDVAFYTVFAEQSGGPLVLDSTRVESRYRLADRGEWPVDTLLYFEAGKDFGRSLYELEAKLILAHDFDRLTLAANAIAAVVIGRDAAETEPEFGFAGGATYQATSRVKLGAETWGAREDGKTAVSAGPALSLAGSSRLWVAMTAGFGLRDADKFALRAIVGIEL